MPSPVYQLVPTNAALLPGQHSLVIDNPGDRSSKVGKQISYTITSTDYGAGAPAIAWTATGLPAGLSIAADPADNTNGIISGTATTAGTSAVTVTATDRQGYSDQESFNWVVQSPAAQNVITVSPQTTRNSKPNTTVPGFTAMATDSDSSITSFAWSDVVAGNHTLPTGLVIDPAAGVVSGTTSAVSGSFLVTLTATDSTGASGQAQFTWNVGTATPKRFPGDPGLGQALIGTTDGGSDASKESLAYAESRVFGGTPAKPNGHFNAVRIYHPSDTYRITSGEQQALAAYIAKGYVPFFDLKENPYGVATIAAVAKGTASTTDTNNLNADIAYNIGVTKALGGPLIHTIHHEPDGGNGGEDFPDATSQDNFRVAFRYVVSQYKAAGVTNVAWCSPMFVGVRFRAPSKKNTFQQWHPNWDGVYLSNGKPRWDYDVLDLDAIDVYDPTVLANLTPDQRANSRNNTWDELITNCFIKQRADSGAKQLPWVIGEFGTYSTPSTLKANGVTVAQINHDAVTIGVAQQGLVGWTAWNNNLAAMDGGPNDPGDERAKALKAALSLLPVAVS